MRRGRLAMVLAVGLSALVGCTNVQKGSATGGVIGSAAGAGIGHYATGLGGVPGGLIGLGLGAAGGAIASESMNVEVASEPDADMQGRLDELDNELAAKNAQMKNLEDALEREKAQQKALLEAYEKSRNGRASLQANVPAGVEVTSDGQQVTYSIMSEVLFQSGKAGLTSAGKQTLRQAAAHIRQRYPNAPIEVRGHTDNVPIRYSSYKSNWELSCARALTVLHYLVESSGLKGRQISAVGCGDTQPVASNNSPEGRRKNRRAELVVRLGSVKVAGADGSR